MGHNVDARLEIVMGNDLQHAWHAFGVTKLTMYRRPFVKMTTWIHART